MNNEEFIKTIEELKNYDNNFESHLKDLLLLAKYMPNQYTLAISTLRIKVAKYKK